MTTNKTVEQKVLELEERIGKLEDRLSSYWDVIPSTMKAKKSSAKEFLMTKSVRTETEKTLVLAYYLEYLEGVESFNVSDLEAIFRSAKEKPPKNINDAVNKNIARGLMMEAKEKKDTKKALVLTSTGEEHVEERLKKPS